MILYLLFLLMIIGTEGSQTANVTVEEPSRAEGNWTCSLFTDENFQDQEEELPHGQCQQDKLQLYSRSLCVEDFHMEMLNISTEDWCLLESISRPYSILTSCLENMSRIFNCYYPNPDTRDFFLQIHLHYFWNCTKEELHFEDAPHWLVMSLTLVPVSLIPILVYLVIWKSKVQE